WKSSQLGRGTTDPVRALLRVRLWVYLAHRPISPDAWVDHFGRRHSGKMVYRAASAAISADVFVPVLSSRTYGMPLAFKNDCNVPKLTAKLTFCGMSPISSAIFSASNLPTTTPATLPFSPNRGPPLLPGCTGAVI